LKTTTEDRADDIADERLWTKSKPSPRKCKYLQIAKLTKSSFWLYEAVRPRAACLKLCPILIETCLIMLKLSNLGKNDLLRQEN
jgi:hypothetical protein